MHLWFTLLQENKMYANCKDEGNYKPDSLLAGDFPRIANVETIIGGNYKRGQVLGKITASGKYTASTSKATDGSQIPLGILAENVNATDEDKQAVVYSTGEFNLEALTYDSELQYKIFQAGVCKR